MKRTPKQNAALHKYLRLLAEALDGAGYDMRTLVKIPIRPTPENVKESLWRPVQQALYPDIESTTELDTKQVNDVYEVLDRATGEKLGIHVDFPCEESLSEAQRE